MCLLRTILDPWDEVNHQIGSVFVHGIQDLAELENHLVIFDLERLAGVCVSQAHRDCRGISDMLLAMWMRKSLHLMGPIS